MHAFAFGRVASLLSLLCLLVLVSIATALIASRACLLLLAAQMVGQSFWKEWELLELFLEWGSAEDLDAVLQLIAKHVDLRGIPEDASRKESGSDKSSCSKFHVASDLQRRVFPKEGEGVLLWGDGFSSLFVALTGKTGVRADVESKSGGVCRVCLEPAAVSGLSAALCRFPYARPESRASSHA